VGWAELILGPLERAFRSRASLGIGGEAKICDHDHIPIYIPGEDLSRRTQARHVDVELRVWNKGHEPFSLMPTVEARGKGQALQPGSKISSRKFPGVELPVGGLPQAVRFYLRPLDGEPLTIQVGERITLVLTPTRGRRKRRVRVPVTAAKLRG
jgi:hypothetical protein